MSNFTARHLRELVDHARIVPAVNQIELHPYLQQRDTVAFCRQYGIAVTAYSPLTKGIKLDDPEVCAIAVELGKTPAQVLLRWSLEQGYIVIPKSGNRARIIENAAVFDFRLSPMQHATLSHLEEGLHTAWDPADVL